MSAKSVFVNYRILPVGSQEYHGERLPPDTDSLVASRVASDLADRLREYGKAVSLLPSVPYGASAEHLELPSTISITNVNYYSYMADLLSTAATDGDLIVCINGHGGNANILAALEADFNYSHSLSKLFVPHVYSARVKKTCVDLFGEFDAHAGSVEASLVAYYHGLPAEVYEVQLGKQIRGSLRFFPTRDLNPRGIIKRIPTVTSDPDAGKRIQSEIVEDLAESVVNLDSEISQVIRNGDS